LFVVFLVWLCRCWWDGGGGVGMGYLFIYLFIAPFTVCNFLFLNVEGGKRKGGKWGA